MNPDESGPMGVTSLYRGRIRSLLVFAIVGILAGAGLFFIRQQAVSMGTMTATLARPAWIPYFNFALSPKAIPFPVVASNPLDAGFFARAGLDAAAGRIELDVKWNTVELRMRFDPASVVADERLFAEAMSLIERLEREYHDETAAMLVEAIADIEAVGRTTAGGMRGDVTDLVRFQMSLESLSPPTWREPIAVQSASSRSRAASLLLHLGVGLSLGLALFVVPVFFERPLEPRG